jgi:hypothetical protein
MDFSSGESIEIVKVWSRPFAKELSGLGTGKGTEFRIAGSDQQKRPDRSRASWKMVKGNCRRSLLLRAEVFLDQVEEIVVGSLDERKGLFGGEVSRNLLFEFGFTGGGAFDLFGGS